jgi:hypothetical protein
LFGELLPEEEAGRQGLESNDFFSWYDRIFHFNLQKATFVTDLLGDKSRT